MRKALALALAVTVTIAGMPAGLVAAAVVTSVVSPVLAGQVALHAYSADAAPLEPYTDEFPQDASGIRHARRLGGRTAFNRPALTKISSLQQMLKARNAAADIRKVLSDAGIAEVSGPRGSVADTVIGAMSSWPEVSPAMVGSCDSMRPQEGVIAECDFQPGSMMQWMALRPNAPKDRTAGIVERVRWDGAKPFRAFIFSTTAGGKIYTFVVPKDCGNLALLEAADVPPPPAPPAAPSRPAPTPQAVTPPPAPPAPAQQPTPPPQQQSLDCVATGPNGQPLTGAVVRARDAQGNIVATATTDQNGRCFFGILNPGTYTVELVNPAGTVIGVSAPTTVVAGSTATAAVATSAVSALAIASGAAGVVGWITSTAGILTLIAATTVGTLAYTAQKENASPSR